MSVLRLSEVSTPSTSLSEKIVRAFERAILSGVYRPGDRLPGTRDMAAQLAVNRNTTAKVYRLLAQRGLVRYAAKRRPVVLATGLQRPPVHLEMLVSEALAPLVLEAKLYHINAEDLEKTVVAYVNSQYRNDKPSVALVECNPVDASIYSRTLGDLFDIEIRPYLIDEVPAKIDVLSRTDLVVVPLYHLGEFEVLLPSTKPRILPIIVEPHPNDIRQIADLPTTSRIGLIVGSQPALLRVQGFIRAHVTREIRSASIDDEEALNRVIQQSDVLVCTRRCFVRLPRRPPNQSLLILNFRIVPESIEEMRGVLASLARPAQAEGDRERLRGSVAIR